MKWREREKCNRPMLLIERQKAMLLEVYKCIRELGPRYRHGMFSQKSRAYEYRNPSILTLPKYNTNTHGKKCFMYEGAKLWNSIMVSKQQRIFENSKLYLINGMELLAYVKLYHLHHKVYVIEGFNGMLYVFFISFIIIL